MSTITKRLLTLLIVLLALGIVFYPRLKEYFDTPPPTEGKAAGNAPAGNKGPGKAIVSVMVVEPTNLDDVVKTTGTVLANEEVEIRSEVSGKIINLYFKEGQYVQRGALLLRINDDDLQAQLKKFEYNKKLAEDNEARQRRLLEIEAISQREYEISLTSVKTIEADIENIRAQIAKTSVRAPFSGKLGLRYVSEGSYITPTTRISTLTNTNPAKVEFSVPAKYADAIRNGSRIEFQVESSERKHEGQVYAVDPKIDPQTRTLQMRATSPNPSGTLLPGAFARIELVIGNNGTAITIPNEALIPEQQGHKVFVVKNGKASSRMVELGARGERSVEIVNGLSSGDTLIVTGILQVKPEGPVEVREVINQDNLKLALKP
ncbi:efflux RND transporter periplasmic adaptor subunit [Telluribacter humicola]|uniref:efflux RND transporter periplasmic adaptor subunit n=1 Tax=Telluribacter humicola TaxID=1720261 RepID=UPI001A95F541|nr:efflux RND transporter periplasmic adaptor subunit [Telluribacter humicola]